MNIPGKVSAEVIGGAKVLNILLHGNSTQSPSILRKQRDSSLASTPVTPQKVVHWPETKEKMAEVITETAIAAKKESVKKAQTVKDWVRENITVEDPKKKKLSIRSFSKLGNCKGSFDIKHE